jgi:hypothetical protein
MLCINCLNRMKLKVIDSLIIHIFCASSRRGPEDFTQIEVMLMNVAAVSISMRLLISWGLKLVLLLLLLLHH